MKFLITGATGLVGKTITEHLIGKGHHVNFLTTRPSKATASEYQTGFYWNPKTGEIDTNCFEGVQTVINLAGASVAERWTSSHKKSILDSRLDTLNLLFSTLKNTSHSVNQLITASAIGVYPSSRKKLYKESESVLSI